MGIHPRATNREDFKDSWIRARVEHGECEAGMTVCWTSIKRNIRLEINKRRQGRIKEKTVR